MALGKEQKISEFSLHKVDNEMQDNLAFETDSFLFLGLSKQNFDLF